MFSISKVVIVNFKSYKGEHTWVLPTVPGLYLITGQNLVTDSFDKGGVGKTTILDAISWALTGRTTRGDYGPGIVAYGQKGASVTVYCSVGGIDYEVTATQSPNSLTVNGSTTDYKSFQQKLRLSHESFCYSVILPQFEDAFLDLKASEKLTLFSQIMELDYWLDKSAKADAEAKSNLDSQAVANKELLKLETIIELLNRDIDTLKKQASEWDSEHKAELKALREEHRLVNDEIFEIEAKITELKTTQLNIKGEVGLLDPEMASEGVLAVTQAKIEELEGLLLNFDHQVCPACNQSISAEYALSEVDRIEIHVEALKIKATSLAAVNNKIKALFLEDSKAERSLIRAESEHKSLLRKESVTTRALRSAEVETNLLSVFIEEKKNELSTAELDAASAEIVLDELKARYEAINFWVAGFKRLRLLIIERTLKTLEIEVNNTLSALCLTSWRMEFDIERENKAGGVTKGFTVLIHEPDRQAASWHSWSGCETQFLKLAGSLGLSNLIMERAGLNNKIEFYDEISQHMPPKSVERHLEVLHHRAHSLNKVIFCIDHNAYNSDCFDGQITVIKDENGSRITTGGEL